MSTIKPVLIPRTGDLLDQKRVAQSIKTSIASGVAAAQDGAISQAQYNFLQGEINSLQAQIKAIENQPSVAAASADDGFAYFIS